jgi:hypothetical protein
MDNKNSEDNTTFYVSLSSMICIFILIIIGGIFFYIYYIKDDTTTETPPTNQTSTISINESPKNSTTTEISTANELPVIEEPVVYGDVDVEETINSESNTSSNYLLPFDLQDGDIISLKNPDQTNYLNLCNSCYSYPQKAATTFITSIAASNDTPTHAHFKIKILPNGKVNLINQFGSPSKNNYLTICSSADCPLLTTKMNTWAYYEMEPKGERSEFNLIKNYNNLNIRAYNNLLLGRCDNCIDSKFAGTLKNGIADKIASAHISPNDASKPYALWTFNKKNSSNNVIKPASNPFDEIARKIQ